MKIIILASVFFCYLNFSYAQSGTLDPSFGINGIIQTDIGSSFDYDNSARQVLVSPGGSMFIVLNASFISKRLPNGSIDSSYGLNGYASSQRLFDVYAALQADGKIVIAGAVENGSSFMVARINSDGMADSTFGNNGLQITPLNPKSVAIQSDGKIVIAGADINNNTSFDIARYNTDGSPDNSFNGSGQVTTSFGAGTQFANALAIQADGKIIAGGYFYTDMEADVFAIARYNIDGSPDNTFDRDGKLTTAIGSSGAIGYSLAIQADGKIVLAGYAATEGTSQFAVARYNDNGSPDNSFNGNGIQTANVGSDMQIGNSVALQSNGKIVVAGYTLNGDYNDFAIARFNSNGSPDNSFGNEGILTTDFSSTDDYAGSLAVQSDDKIVVAGYSYNYLSGSGVQKIAVSRYDPDGSFDKSFGDNGKLVGDYQEGNTKFNTTAIQADGKIVAAGRTWNGNNYDFAVVRYDINGNLDRTFDGNGRQITDFGAEDEAISIVIQPDGKIVAAGNSDNRFAMARYNSDGSPDYTFSGNGRLITTLGFADLCQSVALQKDGKIVMAGYTFTDANYDSAYFAIVRFNTNGTTDNTFDGDGKQLTDFDSSPSFAASLAIQKDGKIVVGGRSYLNNQNNFALARYNDNGSLDTTFSHDGKQNNVFGADEYQGASLAIQNDGKIILAGYTEISSGGSSSFALARYNTNGELDNSFGDQGFQSTYLGPHFNIGRAVAINNEGRIAVAGTNDNYAIVLYKNDGSCDSTFGREGILTTNIGMGVSSIQGIAFANDKLYAAGCGQFPGTFAVVARYLLEAQGGPLPVKQLDFNAVLQDQSVLLQWQTTGQQGLSHFVVQRGANGKDFLPIDYAAASGNSDLKINYSTVDNQPLPGVNFYRLKIVDKDGKFIYSKIVSVIFNDEIFTFNVFPNPAKNILFVRLKGENEKATFQIIDAGGRILKEASIFLNGNTPVAVNINNLPKGMYILQLHTRTKTQTRRFIKD